MGIAGKRVCQGNAGLFKSQTGSLITKGGGAGRRNADITIIDFLNGELLNPPGCRFFLI